VNHDTMRLLWVPALAVVAAASCSLFTNLDDLGSHDASSDTASDVGSDAVPDVGSDVVDAASDGHFCDPYADAGILVYCQDFDSVDASTLDLVTAGVGATATVDTLDWTSSPASLLVSVPATDGGHAYLAHSMPVTPSAVTLDVDMKVESIGSTAANALVLTLGGGSTLCSLVLDVESGSAVAIQEDTPTGDGGHLITGHGPIDVALGNGWHHFHISLVLDPSPTSSVTIDGMPEEINHPLQPDWTTGLFSLSVGITFTVNGQWSFRYDSVLVELTP
jgi:hypothetical protein